MIDNSAVPVVVKVVAAKPFACHGESQLGKPCQAKLTAAEAWVPAMRIIRRATGSWPSAVRDLVDHVHCGRCVALGRRAGLRFYLYGHTVVEMEKRRAERVQAARQSFKRYF
jgi:hypothetical protein